MDLREIIQKARNCDVETDLWALQDALEEAYARVGERPDPVRHRDELARIEAISAVLRETSQMPDSKASKLVLCSLMIALRQMLTAASTGLVGINIPLGEGDVVWLPPCDMTGAIGSSPDTHAIGSVAGWIRLAAFIRTRRKGLLQDAKLRKLFGWTKACRSDALEEVSLRSISEESIDDSAGGRRSMTAANLRNVGRLLRDIEAPVRTQTAADLDAWVDEVWEGAELIDWIRGQLVPGVVTVEIVIESARMALDVLTARCQEGFLGMVLQRDHRAVRFVAAGPTFETAETPGALCVGNVDAVRGLTDLVLWQRRLGNDIGTIRKALLSDADRKLLKKGCLPGEGLLVRQPKQPGKSKLYPWA
jgi:hypothetical protein